MCHKFNSLKIFVLLFLYFFYIGFLFLLLRTLQGAVSFFVKLRTLQGAVIWERHLPHAHLPTKYLTAKNKYLGTKLASILIAKRLPCNTLCYTRRSRSFLKTSKFLCFLKASCSYFSHFR